MTTNNHNVHYIRITTKCNNRCIFCNVNKTSYVSYKNVIENIKKIPEDTEEVIITGGEPLIEKKLIEYIRLIQYKTNAKITIQTNGVLLAYTDFINKLEKLKVDKLIISYPAHNSIIYKRLTGRDKKYLILALNNLYRSSLKVTINALIHKKSFTSLPQFAQWIVKNYGNKFSILFTTLSPIENALSHPNLFVQYYKTIPYLLETAQVFINSKSMFIIAGMYGYPLCLLPEVLYPYCESYIHLNPNLHREVGEDQFTKSKNCFNCKYDNICLGVWKYYAKKFGLSELKPVHYNKYKYPFIEKEYHTNIIENFRSVLDSLDEGKFIGGNLLVWRITQDCNCKCSMCIGSTGKSSITDFFNLQDIKNILANIKDLGFNKLLLCGGEPTLVKRLPEIIWLAKNLDLSVHLNTNAFILANVIHDCFDAGLDSVIISLDSPDSSIHDNIRGKIGLHKRALQNAEKISKLYGKDRVRFHTLIMKSNFASLSSMVELAYVSGVGFVDMTYVMDALNIDRSKFRLNVTEIYEFFWNIFPEILSKAIELNIKIHISPIPYCILDISEDQVQLLHFLNNPTKSIKSAINRELNYYAKGLYNKLYLKNRICSAPYRDLTIDYDGTVYPCGRSLTINYKYRLGNLKDDALSLIVNNDLARRFRVISPKHPICEKCISFSNENKHFDNIIANPDGLLKMISNKKAITKKRF